MLPNKYNLSWCSRPLSRLNLADGPGELASARRQLDQKAWKTSSESWWATDAPTRESTNHAISCTNWSSSAARPAAAPQGQPYYPGSSRLVLRSCSGPVRIGPSPSHPDRGDMFSSVLALTRDQDTVLRNKYARMIKVSRHNTLNPNAVNLRTIVMPWKNKRSWTADASCRLDSSLTAQYDSELGLGPPEATDPPRRGIQRGRQTNPTKIFATGEYLCAQPIRRALSQPAKPAGIFLCRLEWLRLRGISERKHDPPDSRPCCFHSLQCAPSAQSSGAQWPLLIQVLLDDSRRRPDQVPWYGS